MKWSRCPGGTRCPSLADRISFEHKATSSGEPGRVTRPATLVMNLPELQACSRRAPRVVASRMVERCAPPPGIVVWGIAMPTESSVVSDLIRNSNTRRLESEPGDAFLFQPVPRDQARRTPQGTAPPRSVVSSAIRQPAAKQEHPPAKQKVVTQAKLPVAPRAKPGRHSVGNWLLFFFVTSVSVGWAFVADRLDTQDEFSAATAPTTTITPAPSVAPVAQSAVENGAPSAAPVAPVTQPAALPATDMQAPTTQAVDVAAAPLPNADPPAVATTVTEAPPSDRPKKAPKKHHHSRSKVQRTTTKVVTGASEPAEPSEAAPSAPPPQAVEAPRKPRVQSADSEDPLK